MSRPGFSVATHLSIVWGVTLALMTLLEWGAVERNPLEHEIISPFIERQVSVSVESQQAPAGADAPAAEEADAVLRYDVALGFNGPLFLICFFIPVLIFQGGGALWQRRRGG